LSRLPTPDPGERPSDFQEVSGDVSDLGDIDRLYGRIKSETGRLDVVFANAGIAR
jgi:NAD(P)-dependent dehydrogenase (short-subunit alcohol dehydrogenase family)